MEQQEFDRAGPWDDSNNDLPSDEEIAMMWKEVERLERAASISRETLEHELML